MMAEFIGICQKVTYPAELLSYQQNVEIKSKGGYIQR